MAATNLPAEVIQKAKGSSAFMAIAFVAPKSQQWQQVRNLLDGADELFLHENVICGLFTLESRSVELAYRILAISFKWKSCYLFVNGIPATSMKNIKWLECFVLSLRCNDPRAHCFKTGWATFASRERTITMPCRLMPHYGWYCEAHPSTAADQLQACAVRAGVEQCPNYGKFGIVLPKEEKALTSGLDFLKKDGFTY